ncbi:hypothetical protein BDP27DRAFT_524192 [Rhodocollybia butyracea]|uniref:Uncharacterized protein n=1 Tax=Rhodocollybia butyracea TaxID=206335 RepID=A0A9P5TX54_9AGAR|nr:hypothetical protein BDP27DRAFT_524192 [Rhodocollybia butyracea]
MVHDTQAVKIHSSLRLRLGSTSFPPCSCGSAFRISALSSTFSPCSSGASTFTSPSLCSTFSLLLAVFSGIHRSLAFIVQLFLQLSQS